MVFTEPVPFAEAAQHSAVKVLLPMALDSAEAQEHLSAEVRERARMSSQINNAELLDVLDQQVEKLVQGETDLATARNVLRSAAEALDYKPEAGKEGTIQDFRSNARLKVTLTTCVQMADGYGQYMQGQDPAVLDLFPAQELYRAQARKVPRNWKARWGQAASKTGTKVSGFTALKNEPIWTAISRFGTPYSPFDYYSGMRTRGVARARAVSEGLIDRDTQLTPEDRGFNQDLAFSPVIRSQQLRQAIVEESGGKLRFEADGTLRLVEGRNAGNEADDDEADYLSPADVARAVVDSYDPADPQTWNLRDDERTSLSPEAAESLAFERYLQALFD